MARRQGFYVVAGPEFRTVTDALREVDESLPERLRDALRHEALPVEVAVREAALRLPAHGRKHTGLRARIAAGVGLDESGSRVRFTTSMPPGEEELPRGEDNGLKGWRHPVFGNMNVWVHQRGGSWFRSTIADHRNEFENNLTDALEQAARQISDAGHL